MSLSLRPRAARGVRRAERGVTVLVVLILMSVMVLGGMSLARMTEIGTLAAGNSAFREASVQASEVGLNTAFAEVRALVNEDVAVGTWYSPITLATDAATGLPVIDWSTLPEIVVGAYSVRYVADRVCDAVPIADPLRQCLVKQIPQLSSADASKEKLDPPNAKQFRVSIRVTGPKNTQTFVQSMVTKG